MSESRQIARHRVCIVEAMDVDRSLTIGDNAVDSDERARQASNDGGTHRFHEAARQESAVKLALVYSAKETIINTLVTAVTKANIGDVEVVDQVSLTVILAAKLQATRLHCTNRKPHILFHVNILGLLDHFNT